MKKDDRQTDGHCDSMTDPAQRDKLVKMKIIPAWSWSQDMFHRALFSKHFQRLDPLGWVGYRVPMSVCLSNAM